MLKKTNINLSFKDYPNRDECLKQPDNFRRKEVKLGKDEESKLTSNSKDSSNDTNDNKTKNCWSGYHVKFRNPRNFESYAIDKKFNRWGDMVDFFRNQERPYCLSQGSLKDLLYGTYKRKGKHGLSLNELVSIERIEREKISKQKTKSPEDDESVDCDSDQELPKQGLVVA